MSHQKKITRVTTHQSNAIGNGTRNSTKENPHRCHRTQCGDVQKIVRGILGKPSCTSCRSQDNSDR